MDEIGNNVLPCNDYGNIMTVGQRSSVFKAGCERSMSSLLSVHSPKLH